MSKKVQGQALSFQQFKRNSAIELVHSRIKELQKEHDDLHELANDQVGTEIPKTFTSLNRNMIIDPSNVGTTTLDHMIKTDDTINSAVHFKILMILSKMGEYDHPNPEIKKFVQNYLQDMKSPAWESAMESMLSCHGYRFSVSEVVFGLDGVHKVPKKIATYHPSTLAFEVDDVGEITEDGILQYTMQRTIFQNVNNRFASTLYGFKVENPFSTPTDRLYPTRMPYNMQIGMVRIPRNKVIHMVGQEWHGFGNPYGNSGVRTAHLLWQLKVFMLKQMGIAAKRKAFPKLWGTAPRGAQQVNVKLGDGSEKQVSPVEALRLMLRDLQDFDSIATGPETEGYKITSLADTANLDQFIAVLNALDTRMFRCFLLPSLVMTDGEAGSRSLGDKHFEIVDRIADSDAVKFGKSIVNQMVHRNIVENFGEQKKDGYGSFQRRPQSVNERSVLATMFGQLSNDGWMSPALESDMSLVREQLHLTPVKDDLFSSKEAEGNINGDLPPGGGLPASIGGDDAVEDTAFNGAQVTSLVDLIKQVSAKQLPGEAAVEILITAFRMSREQAEKIIAASVAFTPTPEGGQAPDQNKPGNSPNPADDGGNDPEPEAEIVDDEPEGTEEDVDPELAAAQGAQLGFIKDLIADGDTDAIQKFFAELLQPIKDAIDGKPKE